MKKKLHLELIRFIAICLVVFNHTDGYYDFFATTGNPATYIVSLFFTVLARINVPLFYMVSGALLIKKEEGIKDLYRKRVGRIAFLLVLFSGIQYICAGLAGKIEGGGSFSDFLRVLYSGNVIEPYWFFYSYLAILMVLPFLRRMALGMTEEEFRYMFALKIVFDIILRAAAVYTGSSPNLWLFVIEDSIFYVLAGFYMEYRLPETAVKKGKMGYTVCFILFCIALSMAAVVMEYKALGEYMQGSIGRLNPLLVIAVYYMVKLFCDRTSIPKRMQGAILYLGSMSFGIYLIELLVRRQLAPIYLYLCGHTIGLFACFVYVAGTIGLSVVYVSILKKIPVIGKMI